jgi:hypothetical protein
MVKGEHSFAFPNLFPNTLDFFPFRRMTSPDAVAVRIFLLKQCSIQAQWPITTNLSVAN